MATAPVSAPVGPDPTAIYPHRRLNPLTNEYILVSPHRANRPWQGQTEPPQTTVAPEYDPKCYLCPGNKRTNGDGNPEYSGVYSFRNDFPAVLSPPLPVTLLPLHPLLTLEPVDGACDVIVYHPRHDLTLARLSLSEIESVINEWSRVFTLRGSESGIKHVQIFENKGPIMGCSNPHPHGQVWSTSSLPTIISTELESLKRYSSQAVLSDAPKGPQGQPCLLCDYAHLELSLAGDSSRIVVENDHWLAVVPWWATWPFEILLLPYRRHVPSLLQLDSGEKLALAEILSRLTVRYDNLFRSSFPYSMGIHQRPTPAAHLQDDEHNIAHLHFHFDPPLLRSSTVKKFLVGYELMAEAQRDLTPEQAAARLRACSEVHYLDT